LSGEDREIESILKAVSGRAEFSDEEVLKIALREASRDQFGGWGRVWVKELEKIAGRKIDAASLVEAIRDRGFKVKFVDASGGIIYISI